ncbi:MULTISPECIES: ABC transporter permease [unclassified Chelatococcus]|uniref:ABC transporter permease n=1 Tax=unclassified Chelatococcus TaxID=2638111 RepID=UPI001BCC8DA8|nr:ABC transporter permease [Chelatococcus sp.]MBS7743157.1 ABC transporter permease [Chelatococcus sp. HY11]CAH1651533.1 Dipeptide transport system permease protein DppB [Hyphomicrobiales bacterium]MBX3541725.1 ABC transporter permease [Chelatococcus sp.]MCO5074383.1 ABC transporter permease [Chelatococcus sp.]CAH1693306.1 Dipeptide transport system permease protein DppB [Hyphomicrobiales bacterium]
MKALIFIANRAAQGVIVLLGVSAIVFFALFLTGDPAALMMPPDASRAEIEAFRQAMGFNDPIWVQYGRFLGGVISGEFGNSLRFQRPAFDLLIERLPATALLACAALLWSSLLGFVLGTIAAVRKDSPIDFAIRVISLLGQAIPVFWLALLLIIVFSLNLRWLPSSGIGTFKQLIMPSIALGAYYLSAITRLVRASLIEVLGEQYIRTARAKGVKGWSLVVHHALRNALIPVITVQGIYFASLLGGALVTEIIFAWPGIGRLAVESIQNRDFPVVQAVVLFAAFVFVVVNFLVDLAYLWLNPRIRL